jgi:hypothetical protein
MTDSPEAPLPQYVEARRALLNALFALTAHSDAVVVVGAQAVYLRTGDADPAVAISPFTSDGDLALDPTQLANDPKLAEALRAAHFRPYEIAGRGAQPGAWVTHAQIDGTEHVIPLDLMVPEGLAPKDSHRGAELGIHGRSAARKVRGLEAAVFDNDIMTIHSLDPNDDRSIDALVAGSAALLIAKAHKIGERVASGNANRYDDKDGADVLRLMQTTDPTEVAQTIKRLLENNTIEESVTAGLTYLQDLFGGRAGAGIAMAQRAVAQLVSEEQVRVISLNYVERLNAALSQ